MKAELGASKGLEAWTMRDVKEDGRRTKRSIARDRRMEEKAESRYRCSTSATVGSCTRTGHADKKEVFAFRLTFYGNSPSNQVSFSLHMAFHVVHVCCFLRFQTCHVASQNCLLFCRKPIKRELFVRSFASSLTQTRNTCRLSVAWPPRDSLSL